MKHGAGDHAVHETKPVAAAPGGRDQRAATRTGEALADLGSPYDNWSPGLILNLQQAAGNAAVGSALSAAAAASGGVSGHGLSVQREPATAEDERARIDAAIKSKDAGDVKKIQDVNRATKEEKLELLSTLAYQWWAGVRDEWKMEEIWASFGDQLPQVMASNQALWKQCVSKGADLDKLAAVKRVQVNFMTDVQSLALTYLAKNREYVRQQMTDLGVDGGVASPEQDERLKKVQQMAGMVRDAQAQERELRTVVVGDTYHTPDDSIPYWFHQNFDPDEPPDRNRDKDEANKLRDWQEVMNIWTPVAGLISRVANDYPAIYAAIAQGQASWSGEDKVAALADEKDPTKARAAIAASLKKVLDNINESEAKIKGNDPDYRDLLPLHAKLLTGTEASPSSTDWKGDQFNQWVVGHDLEGYQVRQFWVRLGFTVAAEAAFVVVTFATAGTATFFIAAGIGLAASGIQAANSLDRYMSLERVAQSAVKDDAALVDKATVAEALEKAIRDAVQFLKMVAAIGFKALGGLADKAKKPEATVDQRKFSEYIFKPGAAPGKVEVFESLGYGAEDSDALASEYQRQGAEKYASRNFVLGKKDQFGQRIDIEIELRGKGAAADKTSYLKSGWMIRPDGSISLNTPFSGFTR